MNGPVDFNKVQVISTSTQCEIDILIIPYSWFSLRGFNFCAFAKVQKLSPVIYKYFIENTVDREMFAFKYFRVINVRVSNFRHKVQEVKIIHGVFYFRVLNFHRPRERRKFFNSEYFPIYGTRVSFRVRTK